MSGNGAIHAVARVQAVRHPAFRATPHARPVVNAMNHFSSEWPNQSE
jgi:hypothetical protein